MKLVLCSDNEVGKSFRGVGGVGNHVYELSQALVRLGNDVTIVARSNSSWSTDVSESLHVIGISTLRLKGLETVAYSNALFHKVRSLIAEGLVDAIQFHNLTGIVSYLHRKALSVPIWTKCHGVNDPYTPNLDLSGKLRIASFFTDSTLSSIADKLCYKLSPNIIANSQSTKERLVQSCHVDSERVSVVYNGVNHELFNTNVDPRALRARLGLRGSIVLLFVGDFSFLKGIIHLILTFKRVVNEIPNVSLLLVGGYRQDSRREIEKSISRLGLVGNVKIESYVPHMELPKYYASADVCIVPSLSEPFGNVALEAMACGRPVVAFRVGGLAEIVNRDVGMTLEPKNIESLAEAVLCLIRNEDLRVKMGKRAADYSKKFTWDKTAKKTLEVFERLRK